MRQIAIFVLALMLPALASARERLFGWCELGNQTVTTAGIVSSATTLVQGSYPQCTVTIFQTGSQSVQSGTYVSGGTISGTAGQTITLQILGGSGALATATLTATNTILTGSVLSINAGGSGFTAPSISATCSNGTATCSGTVVITTVMSGTPATLYSDNLGTPLTNPFLANTQGLWYAYVNNGRYDVQKSLGIPNTMPAIETDGDQLAFDPMYDSEFPSITQACSFAAAVPATLTVSQKWPNLTTQTLACDLVFNLGGELQPGSGQALTLQTVRAGAFQIFDVSLGGSIASLIAPLAPVEWWGATNAGLADDSVAWNGALATVNNSATVAQPVTLLARGTYRVDNELSLASVANVTIDGQGLGIIQPGINIRQSASVMATGQVFFFPVASNVTIRGLAIQPGPFTNMCTAVNGCAATEPSRPSGYLMDVNAIWFGSSLTTSGSGTNIVVENTSITKAFVDVAFGDVSDSWYRNNLSINGNAVLAVIPQNANQSGIHVENNDFGSHSDDGVCFCTRGGASLTKSNITDNHFSQTGITTPGSGLAGFRLATSGNGSDSIVGITANDNEIQDANGIAIIVSAGSVSGPVSDIDLSHNTINGYGQTGADTAIDIGFSGFAGFNGTRVHAKGNTIINPRVVPTIALAIQGPSNEVEGGEYDCNVAGQGCISIFGSTSTNNRITNTKTNNLYASSIGISEAGGADYSFIYLNDVFKNGGPAAISLTGAHSSEAFNSGYSTPKAYYLITQNTASQVIAFPIYGVPSTGRISFGQNNTGTIGTFYFFDGSATGVTEIVAHAGANQGAAPLFTGANDNCDFFPYPQFVASGLTDPSIQSGFGVDTCHTQHFGFYQSADESIPTALPTVISPNGGGMTIAQIHTLDASVASNFQAGAMVYCSDCTVAATCVTGGSGHYAVKNGASAWTCQ